MKSLTYLNRYISFNQLKEKIQMIKEVGFDNLSFDLIYGLPTLLKSHWEEDLEKIIQLKPTHLSLYSLTREKKTRLNHLINLNKIKPLGEELAREQFLAARKILKKHNYEHYEISNWALKKKFSSISSNRAFYSKHNLRYWLRKPYLGYGPSAHSFEVSPEEIRSYNPPLLQSYIKELIKKNSIYPKAERLSYTDSVNEFIMLSLRTRWGLNLNQLIKKFSQRTKDKLMARVNNLIKKNSQNKLLTIKNDLLLPTETGMLYLDKITSELFLDRY